MRRARIGIIDFNPKAGTNEDKIHYVEKIRDIIPGGTAPEGIVFREARDLSRYSGLVLTGSALSAANYQRMAGERQISGDDYHAVDAVARQLVNYEGSVFGICFGAQLVAFIRGGRIGTLESIEVGYLDHELTKEAEYDPVFGHLPRRFYGAHLHRDFVKELPDGGKVLATRRGMIYAYRLDSPGGRVWYGCQPHPEMSTTKNATFFLELAKCEGLIDDAEYHKALTLTEGADFGLSETLAKFGGLVSGIK